MSSEERRPKTTEELKRPHWRETAAWQAAGFDPAVAPKTYLDFLESDAPEEEKQKIRDLIERQARDV